jgi:rhamnogalacturonan endolyase
MDEFRQDGITVRAGGRTDLDPMTWIPVRYGRQLWQIGTPDRTAKEFRHGDDYREYALWNQFPKDFPNGVNFVIGQSKERTDWNYAQVNEQKNGQWVGTTWNILFDMPQAPVTGAGILRLAFAGAHNAKLTVYVNGRPVDHLRTAADNSVIRSGIHGQYFEHDVVFDAALLKPGRNTIALEQSAAGNAQKSVMYDCVRLELDSSHPFSPGMVKLKPQPIESAVGKEEAED